MRRKIFKRVSTFEPVKIPDIVVDRLRDYEPCYIKVWAAEPGNNKSGKAAVEHDFHKKPYYHDDKELQDWLKAGGNYGILAGNGVIQIDTDSPEINQKLAHKKTFTVLSGSQKGLHRYFRSNVTENGVLIDKNGKNLGNIQVVNKYVVGPGSIHYTGGVYKVVDDSRISYISKAELEEIFGELLSWTGQRRKEIEQEAFEENEKFKIPLNQLIDISELTKRGDEYQGPHPIHGSETGQNFCVNLNKNLWHCFRCNSGGGSLTWLAVQHGIIQCHEAQKGALKGEKFRKALEIAQELGFLKLYDDLSPDVKRFFEKDKRGIPIFRPALIAKELMNENTYITRREDSMMFWYNTEAGVYEPFAETHIEEQIKKKLGKHTNITRQREILNFIKISTYKDFELAPENLIVVKNGVLNIETGELLQFSDKWFILNSLNIEYKPDADCPKFKKFLSEILTDEADQLTIQELFGFCLLRHYKFQKAFIFVGVGANGKSTLLEILRTFLGHKNTSSESLQNLITSRFSAARLYGKLANIYADLPNMTLMDTGMFKTLTGNETTSGELKFRDRFDFKNYAKLIFSCNALPQTKDESDAFFRRLIIIYFRQQFLDEDPHTDKNILSKLTTKEEVEGILVWALKGLQRLLSQQRFAGGKTIEETREQYLKATDTVAEFINECIVADTDSYEIISEVFDTYKKYCNENNIPHHTSISSFSKEFVKIQPCLRHRKRISGKQVWIYQGVKLIEKEENQGEWCE